MQAEVVTALAKTKIRCLSCSNVIQPGEHYSFTAGVGDGEFYTMELCTRCAAIWQDAANESDEDGVTEDDVDAFIQDHVCCDCPKVTDGDDECDLCLFDCPRVHAAFAEGDSTKPLELPTLTTVLYHLSSAALISVADDDGSTELVKFRAAMRYMVEASITQHKAYGAFVRNDSTAAFDSCTKELIQLAMEHLTATDTSAFPRDAQLIATAIKAVYERRQSGIGTQEAP